MILVRSMSRAVIVTLVSALFTGCAGSLYEWNMQHASIGRSARLSHAELEQVIRTVTQKSLSTIITIHRWTEPGRPDELKVYTELDPSASLMMVYTLRKGSDGIWHIVHYGEGTVILAD